jgi:hypothetical protein
VTLVFSSLKVGVGTEVLTYALSTSPVFYFYEGFFSIIFFILETKIFFSTFKSIINIFNTPCQMGKFYKKPDLTT